MSYKALFNLTLIGARVSEDKDLRKTVEFKREPSEAELRKVLPKRILDLKDVVCWYHSNRKTGAVFSGSRCLGGFEVVRL